MSQSILKALLLETVDKGDNYDFSFKSDGGGFTAQTFEGVDYADPKVKETYKTCYRSQHQQE